MSTPNDQNDLSLASKDLLPAPSSPLSTSTLLSPLRRARVTSYLETRSDAGSIYGGVDPSTSFLSSADPTEMDQIENSVRQSRTIEDFTKIITEFRINRKNIYRDALGIPGGSAAPSFRGSNAGSDVGSVRHSIDGNSEYGDSINARPPTCCCSRENCAQAARTTQEWRDLEADLRLSAEIGQALLRRHDAMHAKQQKQGEEYMQQRDGLMSRLTRSYKETSTLERQLAQTNLNLEATESSNRHLLSELDDARCQLQKLKASNAKMIGAEEKAKMLSREMQDAKQELNAERKRAQAAEVKLKKLSTKNSQLIESLKHVRREVETLKKREENRADLAKGTLEVARQRMAAALQRELEAAKDEKASNTEKELTQIMNDLVKDNENLRQDNDKLKELLDSCNQELASLHESTSLQDLVTLVSPNWESALPSSSSVGFHQSYQLPLASPSSKEQATSPIGEFNADQTMLFRDLDDSLPPLRPTLSEELVVPNADVSVTRLPSTNLDRSDRVGANRPGSRSSCHSSLADSTGQTHSTAFSTPTVFRMESGRSLDGETTATTAGSLRDPTNLGKRERGVSSMSRSSNSGEANKGDYDRGAEYLSSEPVRRERDNRTGQLVNLLDYIQRLFTRLSSADIDTLTRRLQRQHLAGDVGHLARTTVNSILKDLDGLKDHFRRLIEHEARANARDDSSMASKDLSAESMVARKEFFALLKVFRDILCELAKLRRCINEIHINPGNASRLLQEHLGAATPEDKSLLPIPLAVGWLGKMLLGGSSGSMTPGASQTSSPSSASSTTGITAEGHNGKGAMALTPGKAGGLATGPNRAQPTAQTRSSFGRHLAPRASAAVESTSVAVEFKGTHTSAAEGTTTTTTTTQAQTQTQTRKNEFSEPLSSSPPPVGGGLRAGPRLQRGRKQGSLTRVQSKNLSGLFAGTLGNPDGFVSRPTILARSSTYLPTRRLDSSPYSHRPLSRIVDDDEVSLHHSRSRHRIGYGGTLAEDGEDDDHGGRYPGALLDRALRPRGLSDSSIRSTFLDHGESGVTGNAVRMGVGAPPSGIRPSPISRIITPATLALQLPSEGPRATAVADKSTEDHIESPLIRSDLSDNTVTNNVVVSNNRSGGGGVGGVAASLLARSEKVLSFLGEGGGSGNSLSLRPTPSIAALNKAARRSVPGGDIPTNTTTTISSSSSLSVNPNIASAIPPTSVISIPTSNLSISNPSTSDPFTSRSLSKSPRNTTTWTDDSSVTATTTTSLSTSVLNPNFALGRMANRNPF